MRNNKLSLLNNAVSFTLRPIGFVANRVLKLRGDFAALQYPRLSEDSSEIVWEHPTIFIQPYSFRGQWTATLAVASDHYVVPLTSQNGSIAVGLQTQTSGGSYCMALPGATGAHSTLAAKDDHGELANMVQLRRPMDGSATAGTQLVAQDTSGNDRIVFGLLHCAAGTADGAQATDSNRQISFVVESRSGVIERAEVSGTIQFEWLLAVRAYDHPINVPDVSAPSAGDP